MWFLIFSIPLLIGAKKTLIKTKSKIGIFSQIQKLVWDKGFKKIGIFLIARMLYADGLNAIIGGKQLRPNIHIKDMVRVYEILVNAPKSKVSGEIFNVGYENCSVFELANMVKRNYIIDCFMFILKIKE